MRGSLEGCEAYKGTCELANRDPASCITYPPTQLFTMRSGLLTLASFAVLASTVSARTVFSVRTFRFHRLVNVFHRGSRKQSFKVNGAEQGHAVAVRVPSSNVVGIVCIFFLNLSYNELSRSR